MSIFSETISEIIRVSPMNWLKAFWQRLSTPLPRESSTVPTRESLQYDEAMSNFTPRAQQVLALARKEADRFNHHFVGTEHVLLGILRLGQGTAVTVLEKMGLDLESVRREVEKQIGSGPEEAPRGLIPYTPRVKKVLMLAVKESKRCITLISVLSISCLDCCAKATVLPLVF